MRKQVAHTETPWITDGKYIWVENGMGNYIIAELPAIGKALRESNAAFIVKAANSYELMIEALEDAQKMGITLMDEVVGKKATDWKIVNEAMLAIALCLRKARTTK